MKFPSLIIRRPKEDGSATPLPFPPSASFALPFRSLSPLTYGTILAFAESNTSLPKPSILARVQKTAINLIDTDKGNKIIDDATPATATATTRPRIPSPSLSPLEPTTTTTDAETATSVQIHPTRSFKELEKQRQTFEHVHTALLSQRERLAQLEQTRLDADIARLVMRSHMVRLPHPEPSAELRQTYWKAVCENRRTFAEAVHRENGLLASIPLCISQIRSQLRTPEGATREEAWLRRVRLLELVEVFEAELEEMQRGGGRLDMQEVHCGERYGYLNLVIEGVRRTYFIE